MAKKKSVQNYQLGGPSGRTPGTQSFIAKRSLRKGKTEGIHVRCDREGKGGELCAWMQLQFAKIMERAAKATSDEEVKRKRLKASQKKSE